MNKLDFKFLQPFPLVFPGLTRFNSRLYTWLFYFSKRWRAKATGKRCTGETQRGSAQAFNVLCLKVHKNSLVANYRHISAHGSPFESQGPRLLWGAVNIHIFCCRISHDNWNLVLQQRNQLYMFVQSNLTSQYGMIHCSRCIWYITKSSSLIQGTLQEPNSPGWPKVNHGSFRDRTRISNQTYHINLFLTRVSISLLSLIINSWLTIEIIQS